MTGPWDLMPGLPAEYDLMASRNRAHQIWLRFIEWIPNDYFSISPLTKGTE